MNSPPIPTLRNKNKKPQHEYEFDGNENLLNSSPHINRKSSGKNEDNFEEDSIPLSKNTKMKYSPDSRPINPSSKNGYSTPIYDDVFPSTQNAKIGNSPISKFSPTRTNRSPVAKEDKLTDPPTTPKAGESRSARSKASYDQLTKSDDSPSHFPSRKPQNHSPGFENDFDPFQGSSKMQHSPPIKGVVPQLDEYANGFQQSAGYDLQNLPADAFQNNAPAEEPEVVPRILSLTLPQRDQQLDTESDFSFTFPMTKESALSVFSSFIDSSTQKMIDSRVFKQRISGLNVLQEKLESLDDLTEISLPVFRALEKSPGWSQSNSIVNQLIINILRHVIIKAESIQKSTISIILPFLIEKLSDRKLKTSIIELFQVITEALCPSFLIFQVCEICATNKGQKSMSPKTVSIALSAVDDLISIYGIGNISLIDLMPHLLKLLQHKTPDVKNSSSIIAKYLYKEFGDAVEKLIADLPGPVFDRLKEEFSTSQSLPDPTKSFCRVKTKKSPVKIAIKREPLSKQVTNEDIESATTAKKFAEQRKFLDAVEAGLQKCKYSIISTDLDSIMRVFKTFLNDGNKNLVLRSLSLLETIAKAADKGISKEVSKIAPGAISAWSDQRPNIREQATKTIDAFCVHTGPSIFIKSFSSTSFKPSSETRLEIIKWILSHIDDVCSSDREKIIPFALQCVEDRSSVTRQNGLQIAVALRDSCPDAFESALKSLPQSSQRTISGHIDSLAPFAPSTQSKLVGSPEKTKRHRAREAQSTEKSMVNPPDEKQAQKEIPRFTSTPTQGKKIKRLKQQQVNLGLAMISNNKQTIPNVLDKTKNDAQAILPPSIFQKMFSTNSSEQIEAIQDIKFIFSLDSQTVCMCSDIFSRWFSIRVFDKNTKIITETINFLMEIFTEDTISIQEMEIIVPLVFWCVESKPSIVIDSALDLLFVIRTHSDPTEYSTVLRSCFDICNEKSLIHLFCELQFTVIDDPRNTNIFNDIIGFLEHKSDEVAAACGGVLALLARRIQPEALSTIYDNLSPDKRDALSAVIPIEPPNTLNFDNFNRLPSIEKIRSCRRLLELLKTKLSIIQPNSEMILDALLHELVCQETDFTSMRLVLFSIHSLLMYCTIKSNDLGRALKAITYFGNRWQKKLVLMEGASIAQTVNSILFKLFEKIPPIQLFTLLLDGMSNFVGAIPADSFYCKCWVAISNQIEEMTQPSETSNIIQFSKEKYEEFGAEDVRGKLCNAIIFSLSGKKKASEQQQSNIKREPLGKSLQRSPVRTITRENNSNKATPPRQESIISSKQNSPTKTPSVESKFTAQKPLSSSQRSQITDKNRESPSSTSITSNASIPTSSIITSAATTKSSPSKTTTSITPSQTSVTSTTTRPTTNYTSATGHPQITTRTTSSTSTSSTNTTATTATTATSTGTTTSTRPVAAKTTTTAGNEDINQLRQRLSMLKSRWNK